MAKRAINIETKKKLANHTLKWCKKNLGINKRKKAPKISLRVRIDSEDENEWFGGYVWEENKIIIYLHKNKSMWDIVSTVIHEYTHYLQSMRKYYEYFNTHYYSTHPYEKQAIKNANKFSDKCLYQFKKLVS